MSSSRECCCVRTHRWLSDQELRYERQFVCDRHSAQNVDAIIRLHPAGFCRVHPPRQVNNVYLDSEDFSCYQDHIVGVGIRQKYRLRWYGPPGGGPVPVVLERKLRTGQVACKMRVYLGRLDPAGGLSAGTIRTVLAGAQMSPDLRVALAVLRPVLLNRYHRQYFESLDRTLRLTLDQDQWFAPVSVSERHPHARWRRQADTVLELKYAVDAEDAAAWAAQALPFRLARHSKYIHGIDRARFTLAPEAPRTARRHGLITAGGAIAVGLVDRLAMILATLAGLCVLVRTDPARGASGRASASTHRARQAGAIEVVVAPVVCLIAFAAVVMRIAGAGDQPYHIEAARLLAENNEWLPHFGFHAVVIVVHALTPADWVDASGIVMLGGIAAGAGVVAWWLRGALSTSASALLVAAALVPAALFVLQPVLPVDPTGYDAWLFGYFPPNQWHSPTTLFSKPFALLLLGLGPAVVWPAHGSRAGRTRILTSAALLVMSSLVKPNFSMAFLPALGALAVLHWRHPLCQ